jgi:hypothetical protein
MNIGETIMRIAKEDVDIKMEIPGAVIRQRTNFGDATGLGKISGEYFSLSAGVDTTPLFQGLEGNLCQCPHWGFVLRGQLTTTDANGAQETVNANDLFYWPPGHLQRINNARAFLKYCDTILSSICHDRHIIFQRNDLPPIR